MVAALWFILLETIEFKELRGRAFIGTLTRLHEFAC